MAIYRFSVGYSTGAKVPITLELRVHEVPNHDHIVTRSITRATFPGGYSRLPDTVGFTAAGKWSLDCGSLQISRVGGSVTTVVTIGNSSVGSDCRDLDISCTLEVIGLQPCRQTDRPRLSSANLAVQVNWSSRALVTDLWINL